MTEREVQRQKALQGADNAATGVLDEEIQEDYDSAVAGGDVPTFESIERDTDLESTSQKNAGTMTYEQFEKEWIASGMGRDPSQEEYETWIANGYAGQLYTELGKGEDFVETVTLSDGTEAKKFTDVSGLGNTSFDWINDDQYAVVPAGTDLHNRYRIVQEFDDGTWLVYKEEKEDWYEDSWVAPVAAVAATVVTGGLLGPVAGSLATGLETGLTAVGIGNATASIAASALVDAALAGTASGIGSGVAYEVMGGDFAQGFQQSFASGAIGGAVGGLAGTAGFSRIQTAAAQGVAAAGYEYVMGGDFGEAAQAALWSGSAEYAGLSDEYGALKKAGVRTLATISKGGNAQQAALSFGQTIASDYLAKAWQPGISRESKKIWNAARGLFTEEK